MTSARFQPFCRKRNINIGCFVGTTTIPGTITEIDKALKIQGKHFCLNWKN